MANSPATPALAFKCEHCMNCVSVGFKQVGRDDEGGGPEEHYICTKGIEPSMYNRAVEKCTHPTSQDELDFIEFLKTQKSKS